MVVWRPSALQISGGARTAGRNIIDESNLNEMKLLALRNESPVEYLIREIAFNIWKVSFARDIITSYPRLSYCYHICRNEILPPFFFNPFIDLDGRWGMRPGKIKFSIKSLR